MKQLSKCYLPHISTDSLQKKHNLVSKSTLNGQIQWPDEAPPTS